ncbi:double-strand break repair helicase AddA [Sphingomonas profundi]|uniref:double-strand break repair helicase AddA n=1 Tax=Alterirhizorhabdus profundi TaxID=2681549 RepID=UPI0012E7C5D7|nr:double-strand break repair helicase AddA [Sphingomonas profundi]
MSRHAPFIPLKGEQLLASDPAELVWLSASAGTGKTHVLSARVLRLLLHGTAPEAILCLTFTKAGAAEMAERVHRRLAAWVRMKPNDLAKELFALGEPHDDDAVADARTLFARVLDAPGGGLRIQTIHSFCQTLLGGFPSEAGLTPGFRPLDPREGAALARRTLAALVAEAEAGGRLGLIDDLQTLSRRLGEAAAEAYLQRCARAPEAMAALGQGIAAKVRRALDVPSGDVEAMIAAACGDDAAEADGIAPFALASLRAVAAANAAWGTATGLAAADRAAAFLAAGGQERAALLDEIAALVLTKDGSPRKASPKLLAAAADYADHAGRLGDACAALSGLRRRAALADLIAAGLRAGQAYAQAFEAAKRAAGMLDFDDLIRLAERLLLMEGIGDWVRYKLDQATDHILVDEAQDTNGRQWTIVAALAAEFFAGDGARGGRPRTIFTVGDFKQAIYGFQGTDPAAFRAAGLHFAERARGVDRELLSLSLDRSFRSSPPVLEVVDRLLDELGPERLGLDATANPHVSAKAHLPGVVTLWRPVAAGAQAGDDEDAEGEEGWIDDATRAFAGRLARQIRAWLDDPFRIAGKGRDLRPEDILILVRSRGALASLIVARLHAEGVPVAGVDRLRLTAPLAVRDLLAAIRFALQPADDLSLASLLVSPLFGVSQDDLYRIGFGRPGTLWDALRAAEGFAAARAGLGAILAQADLTTPYRFLETILSGPLQGRARLLARLGSEARDPIEELVNAALAFEAADTPSLQRFLDWFDRGEVDITRDPSAPLDAVRVMTVHGAKGLQAPLVILADATADPEAGRLTDLDWTLDPELPVLPVIRPRKEELAGTLADDLARIERREREEHWRLLYVAATRAEERLVIGGALGPRAKGEPPAESWYRAIEDALSGLGAEWEADADWGEARHHRGGPATTARTARPRTAVAEPAAPDWLRRDPPKEERPPRPLAPSAIGRDLVADPPPGAAMRAAADRGRLLHALFERLPAIAAADRADAAGRWLERSAGIADVNVREGLVADACAIIADPRFADLFGPESLAEAPIAAVVAGDVIAGTVDRLLVTADRVRVIDFKTGRRVPAGLAAVPGHHVEQMAAYVAALEQVFPGRAVEAALLYTAGPILIDLPAALLGSHKPGLTGTQQILPLDGGAAG